MILTPEQEALVEAGADVMRNDPFWDDNSLLGTTQHDQRLEHYARAIIPLIYTAGRRAGREEAAKVADEQTRLNAQARRDRADDTLAFEFEGLGSVISTAIRNLSEQESGR